MTLQVFVMIWMTIGNFAVAYISWLRYKNELRLYSLEQRQQQGAEEKTSKEKS